MNSHQNDIVYCTVNVSIIIYDIWYYIIIYNRLLIHEEFVKILGQLWSGLVQTLLFWVVQILLILFWKFHIVLVFNLSWDTLFALSSFCLVAKLNFDQSLYQLKLIITSLIHTFAVRLHLGSLSSWNLSTLHPLSPYGKWMLNIVPFGEEILPELICPENGPPLHNIWAKDTVRNHPWLE